jgi:hypothetical protein
MTALAALFPSLRGAPTDPWDSRALIRWCASFYPAGEDPPAAWAARFLLAVWNPDVNWTELAARQFSFNLMPAWAAWDTKHRAAAVRWLVTPF